MPSEVLVPMKNWTFWIAAAPEDEASTMMVDETVAFAEGDVMDIPGPGVLVAPRKPTESTKKVEVAEG